jgi:hypothetical protein
LLKIRLHLAQQQKKMADVLLKLGADVAKSATS